MMVKQKAESQTLSVGFVFFLIRTPPAPECSRMCVLNLDFQTHGSEFLRRSQEPALPAIQSFLAQLGVSTSDEIEPSPESIIEQVSFTCFL